MVAIGEVFISHTHSDAELARALSDAIGGIFADQLKTTYSTNPDLEGGIKPGEEWFRWIVQRVQQAAIAVILITPASVQKPWVLWEAGAVYGAGIASSEQDARKVRPLLFRLTGSQVPSPFAGLQNANGDSRDGIERFMLDLLHTFEAHMQGRAMLDAGIKVAPTVEHYLGRVEKALRDAPLLPTEATVQEWCDRIDELTRENRLSELPHLHDWLNLAFGRGRDDQPLALDLRIHRRLGAAYLASKEPLRAIDQYRLALSLTPRDIFLLRACGQAQLDANQFEAAAQTMGRITELDAQAFTHNVECAALKGRLQRRQNNLDGAADTYRRALENHPESYYLADVLGQVLLQLGKLDEARSAYRRAGQIVDSLPERNVWTHATRATAALANGDNERVVEQLTALVRLGPTPDEIERILRGLDDVRTALGLDQSVVQRFSAVLKGS